MPQISLDIQEPLADRLRTAATQRNYTVSSFIVSILAEKLNEDDETEKWNGPVGEAHADFDIESIPGIIVPKRPLTFDAFIDRLAAGLTPEDADSLSDFLEEYGKL